MEIRFIDLRLISSMGNTQNNEKINIDFSLKPAFIEEFEFKSNRFRREREI